MKKLILLIALMAGLSASGQYTYIANRYEWLAGVFRALGIPAGSGPAAFQPTQRQAAGAIYYDSVGVDSGLYVWSGLAWNAVSAGGGGANIYNTNGSLTGTRSVDLNGNALSFESSTNQYLILDPTVFTSTLAATDGSPANGTLVLSGDGGGIVKFDISAADGVNNVGIVGNAVTGAIAYTGLTHNFTGTVTIPSPFTLGATSVTTSGAELNFVDNVTSDIQTQLNNKASLALDNLASVQTNADIIPAADNTRDMGSAAKSFKDYYGYTYKAKGSTSGTITYKSDALANAPNVINLTGTGYVQVWHEARETSNFTGQNINTVQPMFNTAIDVLTVQASTAYDFEIVLSLNHGATSHSVGISFELAGGASLTSITYMSICWVTAIGTNTASQTTNFIQAATNTAVNAAGANATEQIYLKGTINVNAAGTITPSYTFSAAPGGTALTIAGSGMKFAAKGTNTFTSLGPFN